MEASFWYDYGLFSLKALTLALVVLLPLLLLLRLRLRRQRQQHTGMQVTRLNETYARFRLLLAQAALPKAERRRLAKETKTQQAQWEQLPRLYVLRFQGDLKAHATPNLQDEISLLLTLAQPGETVLLQLESGGGLVNAYGLAASQLLRLKAAGLKLVVAVDKVAASGGYLMAACGDQILAAPFALVGSIGVVAQLPNLNRWLKEHGVDYELLTAGEFKRTLTLFGENDEKGRQKMQAELEAVHGLFKGFLAQVRPALNLDQVATGEAWYGTQALEKGLIDQIQTGEDFLLQTSKDHLILLVETHGSASRWARFFGPRAGGVIGTWQDGLRAYML